MAERRYPKDGRKPSKAWATCRGCGEIRGLRKDATIRRHLVAPGGEECEGSNLTPRFDQPITLAAMGADQ